MPLNTVCVQDKLRSGASTQSPFLLISCKAVPVVICNWEFLQPNKTFPIFCSGGASPKFVVTLDAVTDMSKLLPHTANIDIDDIDLLDNSNMDASESSKTEVSYVIINACQCRKGS